MKKTITFSYWKIILATILGIALIAGIVVLATPKDTTAYATMECSVNPDVQFVLNSQERVITVVCLNEDAQVMISETSFEGKTAEEAANLFTQLCVNAGYIDPATNGTTVEITFTCPSDVDLTAVRARVRTMVNTYFENNGIIACASTSVQNSLQGLNTMAQGLGIAADRLTNRTEAQIMAMVQEQSQYLKEIAYSLKSQFLTDLQTIRTQFSTMFTLEGQIETLLESLDNTTLTEQEKALIRTQLETAQTQFNTLQAQFDAAVEELRAGLKEDSDALLAQIRTQLQTRLQNAQAAIDPHKQQFQQNRAQIQQQIENYRNSVENPD